MLKIGLLIMLLSLPGISVVVAAVMVSKLVYSTSEYRSPIGLVSARTHSSDLRYERQEQDGLETFNVIDNHIAFVREADLISPCKISNIREIGIP